ncbi:MAG: tetratricopeptide repeat protein [Pirellulales bacterium]|nr:tetratricopeptide repeat protein [Pirellulales bacterium]
MSPAPRTVDTEESKDRYLAGWDATMKLLREGKSFSGRERNCAFINHGNQHFSDVSSVTGLDFPEDGRGLIAVDWDRDGDLDLWISNRTGPRLRLMRNNSSPGSRQFVQVKLQGTTCNRDAIGARVELVHADASVGKSIRTLYAGDAYLSQSSKWLHFGVPDEAEIEYLSVRWPDGKVERFPLVAPGRRVLVKQGTGVAEPVLASGDPVQLQPSKPRDPLPSGLTRTVLVSRPPAPLLQYYDAQNVPVPIRFGQRPVLVNLWSANCGNCLAEIKHWAAEHEALSDLGLEVVLLSLDRLPGATVKQPALLQGLPASFRCGYADAALVDKLNILRRVAAHQSSRVVTPMSFLFDRWGGLAALYLGKLSTPQLLDDLRQFGPTSQTPREAAVPFAGRWTAPPRNLLLRSIADVFRDHGYEDDYLRIRQFEVAQLAQRRSAAPTGQGPRDIDTRFAEACFGVALELQTHGQLKLCIEYFKVGLGATPEVANAQYYLALAYEKDGQQTKAVEHLQLCLQYDPGYTKASLRLAGLLAGSDQQTKSVTVLRQTTQAAPDSPEAHFQLGMALVANGKAEEALQSFLRAVELRPDHGKALANAAVLLARGQEFSQARELFERALEIPPRRAEVLLGYGGVLMELEKTARAIEVFNEIVEQHPKRARVHVALANALQRDGHYLEAADHLEVAVQLKPHNATSLLRLAWLRATAPEAAARNGKQALQIAEKLQDATSGKHPKVWDTMAVAHAELGDFDAAVATAQRAVEILGDSNPELVSKIRKRIEGYKAEVPYRE